jgi:antitoxin (DNA-binding transcriptional repressor) of toxin-antitoxin stability system
MNLNYGYNSIMTTITAVDLRENLNKIIQRAANGEEVLISYRGQTLTKIVPTQNKKPNGQAILDFVNVLKKNQKRIKSNSISSLNLPPDEEKKMWQEQRANDFFQKHSV